MITLNQKLRRNISRLTRHGKYRYKITRYHTDGDITVRIYIGNITQRYIIDVTGHIYKENVFRGCQRGK